MDRHSVINALRQHQAELQSAGVVHLRVFGSVARDENTGESDVDVLADFDPALRLTLLKVGSVQHKLSRMLGVPVDLSCTDWMREPLREAALQEAVVAF